MIGFALTTLMFLICNPLRVSSEHRSSIVQNVNVYTPPRPALPDSHKNKHDPIQWLRENSDDRHATSETAFLHLPSYGRPRAAIISLVRNSELPGMMQSIRQLEERWNHKYHVRFLALYYLCPEPNTNHA